MLDSTYLGAVVAVAFACSAALVLAMKYDMRVYRAVKHETYWRWPGLYRVSVVIRLTIKLYVLAYLLAWLTDWLFGDVAKWTTGHFQLYLVLPAVLVFALTDVLRCLDHPVWDLFVSYKSEDVELVRAVVDKLISVGVQVWFAEYQILLQNYDQFQDAVDYGLRNCAYGIAFTDDRYFGSKECRHELAVLLDHLPPEKILQVKIPRGEPVSHSPFPHLNDCPGYEGEDVNEGKHSPGWCG